MTNIGLPGRRLAAEPPKDKELIEVKFTIDRETAIKVHRRCLALRKYRTDYLRSLIDADLDSPTDHAVN
jgi:hypothetical protein